MSVKLSDDVKSKSFEVNEQLYIDPANLIPQSRFLPQPPCAVCPVPEVVVGSEEVVGRSDGKDDSESQEEDTWLKKRKRNNSERDSESPPPHVEEIPADILLKLLILSSWTIKDGSTVVPRDHPEPMAQLLNDIRCITMNWETLSSLELSMSEEFSNITTEEATKINRVTRENV